MQKDFNDKGADGNIIEFKISKYCYNAGEIRYFGISKFGYEEEVLIPPYSACRLISDDDDYTIVLDLAHDNETETLNMVCDF